MSQHTSITATASSSGISLAGALTVLFVALKLLGLIDWSWWLVLMPLLATAAIALISLLIFIPLIITLWRKR